MASRSCWDLDIRSMSSFGTEERETLDDDEKCRVEMDIQIHGSCAWIIQRRCWCSLQPAAAWARGVCWGFGSMHCTVLDEVLQCWTLAATSAVQLVFAGDRHRDAFCIFICRRLFQSNTVCSWRRRERSILAQLWLKVVIEEGPGSCM